MEILYGASGSSGIGIAQAKVYKKKFHHIHKKRQSHSSDELAKLNMAFKEAISELAILKETIKHKLGHFEAAIFDTHLLVLKDPFFHEAIQEKISNKNLTAEQALKEIEKNILAEYQNMDNEYMKERALDIHDITERLYRHLLGEEKVSLEDIREETIIIAEELTPSEVVQLNPQYIKGIVTDVGGDMSHTAIISRSLNIPLVFGTKKATEQITDGMLVIVNGATGEVMIEPDEETVKNFMQQVKEMKPNKSSNEQVEQAVTIDGHYVKISANIFAPVEKESAKKNGAEGVGLFRTESIYMGKSKLPSEEEQFEIYKNLLQYFSPQSVTIRTLDIGADKTLPYFQLPEEDNPFLGYRSIRISLNETEPFRTQLRALLKASMYGKLKIMFPFITTIDELIKAKQILQEEKNQLIEQQIEISDTIEIGMMVETPATSLCAEFFADEVDFFSIGTNDLIQYTMAADRMNDQIASLYQPLNPAIIRLIKTVIDEAHKRKKWVSLCGEMARDPNAIPLLVGLGINELSINPFFIHDVKKQITQLEKKNLQQLITAVWEKKSADEIENLVKSYQ